MSARNQERRPHKAPQARTARLRFPNWTRFNYSISCSGCGTGASSPLPGPLTFTATDGTILTPDSFVANSGGYFFASDIIGTNGGTGNVAARGPVPAPEPMSLALLGSSLIGL